MVGHEGGGRPRRALALEVDTVAAHLRELAKKAHRLGREAAPDLAHEDEHVVPAVERLLVLGRARRAVVPRRHDGGVGVIAEVLRQQVAPSDEGVLFLCGRASEPGTLLPLC